MQPKRMLSCIDPLFYNQICSVIEGVVHPRRSKRTTISRVARCSTAEK